MSQPVELPQLSLQRYVDLVRRRRWQLLPVSLLGLLVGAVVAFLIPRYYVAEATIDYHRVDEGGDRGDDPFGKIVRTAVATIPFAAGKAMERLKWPEALSPDFSARTQFEREVRARIQPYDANPGERGRDFALIRVTYRDTDPDRAYTMANAVIDVWKEETVARLLQQHQEQLARASGEFRSYDERCNRQIDELRRIEEQYGINPNLPDLLQREVQKERRDQETRQLELWRRKDAELKSRQAANALAREDLAKLEPRLKPTLADLVESARTSNPQLLAEVQLLQRRWADLEGGLRENTPDRVRQERSLRAQFERLMSQLKVGADDEGMVPNPRYVALAAKVEEEGRALAQLAREVAELKQQIDALQAWYAAQPEGFQKWRERQKDLDTALAGRKEAAARVGEHEGRIAALQAKNPVNTIAAATKPPHPTDPNVFVVALIGAVLGLGVAIGLILLLDLLQGSFKTADDVERGLGLPVLGGMSHLETAEERRSQARGRRRAASAAFAFVALVVVVVTLYYRAPTRLPTVVRELLDLLLGS